MAPKQIRWRVAAQLAQGDCCTSESPEKRKHSLTFKRSMADAVDLTLIGKINKEAFLLNEKVRICYAYLPAMELVSI